MSGEAIGGAAMGTAMREASGDHGRECHTLAREAGPGPFARLAASLAHGLRAWGYRRRSYQWRLAGRHPLKLLGSPDDPWPGDAAVAERLLAGRVVVDAETHDLADATFWQQAVRRTALHRPALGFAWLRDLALASDAEQARAVAEFLVRGWIESFSRFHPVAWAPTLAGRRLRNWLFHAPLILSSSDLVYRSSVLNSMAHQARHLARTLGDAARGVERIEAAAGLLFAGLLLPHGEGWRSRGEAALQAALERFLLPDGGVLSRALEDALTVMDSLISLRLAYRDQQAEMPTWLQHGLDRMGPFLRALLHGDGSLAHLYGAGAEMRDRLNAALALSDAAGRPLANARYTGLMRLKARRSLVLFDAMPPPPPVDSAGAHAGTLAFEFSDGEARMVVNIGHGTGPLAQLSRTTAAHSTLVLADTNSSELRDDGALGHGVREIRLEREEAPEAFRVTASHDGYERRFRLLHQRTLTLARNGARLEGADRLLPGRRPPRRGTAFDIRFHLHPDVVASPTGGGDGVLLKLANRHGWLFEADGGAVRLEESLFLDSAGPRRSRQIVVHGTASPRGADIRWHFERLGTGAKT